MKKASLKPWNSKKEVMSQYLTNSLTGSSNTIANNVQKQSSSNRIIQLSQSNLIDINDQTTDINNRTVTNIDVDSNTYKANITASQALNRILQLESDTLNDSVVPGFDDHLIALEMNDINASQFCMGFTLRVIQRMYTLFNTKWLEGYRNNTLPKWLIICQELLADFSPLKLTNNTNTATQKLALQTLPKDQRRNIRLYILRLILNQPVSSIIAPVINQFLEPILDCCLYDLTNTSSGNLEVYHYFLRDVVFNFCDTWLLSSSSSSSSLNDNDINSDCQFKAYQFLSYLIKVAYDNNSDILRENIKSIGTLIRLWLGNSNNTNDSSINSNLNLNLDPIFALLSSEIAPTGIDCSF
jgi:hypothetical protein